MSYPSSLDFYALLKYSPSGKSNVSIQSRAICYGVKDDKFYRGGNAPYIEFFAKGLAKNLPNISALQACFGADTQLVPVPRSSPLQPGSLWPAKRICDALVANGLGNDVHPAVVRTTRIRRSSSSAGNRPSPDEHYPTLTVTASLLPSADSITVIDDVITRGSTLFAVHRHLAAAFPQATIRYFALIRTISGAEIDKILDPVAGSINFRPPNSLSRNP